MIVHLIVLRCISRSKHHSIIIVQELQLHIMIEVAQTQEQSNCSLPLVRSKYCKNTTLLILPLETVLPWGCFHQAKQKVSSLVSLEEINFFFCLDFLFFFLVNQTQYLLFIFNKIFLFPLHILYTNKSSFSELICIQMHRWL